MRGIIVLVFVLGWTLTPAIRAGNHDKCAGPNCGHCLVPPPPFCPKCTSPCNECRLCLCPTWHAKEAQTWIERLLSCPNFEGRKKAASKLGCRWHADFCQTPEVLTALIAALHCDGCWEVRREAATALRQQNARTPQALLALYIASQLDPHYLVRERATESINILLVLQRSCYKQLFKDADELIKKLRGKYKPGSHDCQAIYSLCDLVLRGATASETATGTTPSRAGEGGEESLPAPSNLPEEAKGEDK